MTQTIEQLQAKVAELEEENARLNSSPTIEACRQMIRDKAVIEASTLHEQLAAAQEDNQKLRIALDSTKRDLIRMRCPDFFGGVRDGYEFSFDNHLVNMIGLINDYTKQE